MKKRRSLKEAFNHDSYYSLFRSDYQELVDELASDCAKYGYKDFDEIVDYVDSQLIHSDTIIAINGANNFDSISELDDDAFEKFVSDIEDNIKYYEEDEDEEDEDYLTENYRHRRAKKLVHYK